MDGTGVIAPLNQLDITRVAVVESQDAVNRMAVNAFLASMVPVTDITTRNFSFVAEARAWATGAR